MDSIIGKSSVMQTIYQLIDQTIDSNATVLIQGESGTGKELVASAIHYNGPRADKPFIKVNCSALTESLLESELFGHVKGSFTGALYNKIGHFQAADSGTLFLDEIGDMSPALQVKLLRVIQEHEIQRVGDTKTIKIDVRLITATNKDPKQLVNEGKFREDLYYRIKVIPIYLPPLRERKEDMPLLIDHFINKLTKKTGKTILGISPEAMTLFMDYNWPGNIRELENTIEYIFVRCNQKMVVIEDLPLELRQTNISLYPNTRYVLQRKNNLNNLSSEEEKIMLLNALKQTNWRRSETAQILNISRVTLWSKMKKYNIRDDRARAIVPCTVLPLRKEKRYV